MKYYEILPTHTETPCITTGKIANLYIEFNYHFVTLQKKTITFEHECKWTILVKIFMLIKAIISASWAR